jgi:hypothetical protein
MTRRSVARRPPAEDAVPRMDVAQPDKEALTGGGFTALLESATQEILAVTYWFDPALHPGPYPVTVRFSGHRVDVKGRLLPSDRFVHDETIQEVVPGSGPISLTARVRGINAGEWVVTARMLGSAHPARESREPGNVTPVAGRGGPAARFRRRWAPSVGSAEPVRTCLTPFARVPGILPGIWGAMVTLGIAVALALQSLVISADHLTLGPVWMLSLVAIVVGIVGASRAGRSLSRRDGSRSAGRNGSGQGGMLLCRMLRRAAYCVPLGSVVIRSTRGGPPYPHTTAGIGARLKPWAGGAGGGRGSRAGGRRLLRGGAGGLHPGATRSSASARRGAPDEAGRAGNFSTGSACAHRRRLIARSVTVEYVVAHPLR